ncbi:16S rRNA (cytosine(1402)-N(4))-methyltransferase RsmH [Rhodoferax sp.]|uniref:16S rRNA (cytosine(1402)-N(4))-methyltransferase RsmH n=1 Tax=Rhodoferax sp. TaxID=50421 RepID=UPI0026299802|nr:16S rRNA (cytosine(1402)-N(4))-methyltransferase RsmH [Rhodoferax sp.]MDD3937443.1 16S rRNA (cytosine(1402)-N(4))-methyltransferase RsmH [Rhodoferax sp.]
METAWTHTTVLLSEAVDALLGATDAADPAANPWPASAAPVFVDATFGRGGHSRLMLSRLPANARLIAFDKDPDALAEAATITDPRFSIRHQGFSHLGELPPASVAGVLLDLGISSPQVDNPARGFSFRGEGPLDMRMDTTRGQSVAEWLAHAELDEILEVIRDYGEERFAGAIAKAIVARRQAGFAISTTTELARIVADAVKTREPGKDPATRTFQAFRIYINAELEELQQALAATLKVLQPGGRLVVISFHSLEDRIVKQFLAKHSREVFDRRAPFAAPQVMQFKVLARIRPGAAEVAANPRSRSAIMRVAERLAPATTEPRA